MVTTQCTISSLSPARRRLIRVFQQLNFGTVENLRIQNGEPLFNSTSRVLRSHRAGKKDGPRAETSKADFHIKGQVSELLQLFDQERNLTIAAIDVQDGLPFRWWVEETAF